jgi:alpha-beta hydrolase superfamily lysophospholipase
MAHSEGTFSGDSDLELYYQRWRPTAPPRAIVAFIHGIGGHSGQSTYTHLINHLGQRGYALYGMDLRGHGRSPGPRGHINQWAEYRADARAFLGLIQNAEPGRSVFLLGQSLGGLIVLEYAVRYPEGLRGVIASAPVLTLPGTSPIQRALLKALSQLWPHLRLSPRLELSDLSRDPDEVNKLVADPLTDPRGSPRLFTELLAATQWMQAHAADLRIPLLLIHGSADPLAPPEESRTFFDKVGIADKTFKLYEGGFHQAFIDVNRQQVLADVAQWLDQHV